MRTALIFVLVLSTIRGCSSAATCTPSQTPVADACTAIRSGQVYGNLTLYIDTGTGPNYQENLCQCSLSLSHTSIKLVFQSLAGCNSFNHSIEVAGYVLNSTTTRIEVVLVSDTTDLWIRTDGVGGICVSVAITPPDNEKRFGITCFHQLSPILTTTTSSHSLTSAALHTETTETTGFNPTSISKSLLITTTETSKTQTNGQGQDNKNLIGPVVGGVSGFVVMVSITAAICCIRKRKHGNNPNVTRSYENENINISESPTPQQTYEYIQQPTYYNQGTSSLSDNEALTYEGITRHDLNEHIYSGISEGRTTATSKNDINDDDYAN